MRSNAVLQRREGALRSFGSSGRTASCALLRSPARCCPMKKARHDMSSAPARMSPTIGVGKRKLSLVKSLRPWELWQMGLHTTSTICWVASWRKPNWPCRNWPRDRVRKKELKAICSVAISGSEIDRQLMIYTGQEREAAGLVDVARTVEEMAEILKVSISKRATLHTDLDKDLPARPGQWRTDPANRDEPCNERIRRDWRSGWSDPLDRSAGQGGTGPVSLDPGRVGGG